MTANTYSLTLWKSYYLKGFFNIGVSCGNLIRPDNGEIRIRLEGSNLVLNGRVDRNANQNGTPRIHGNAALRDWFQEGFRMHDIVDIEILSPKEIYLKNPKKQ